jgi:hypothetical protein
LNASGQGTNVAEVLAVASANPNGGYWNRFVHVVSSVDEWHPGWTNSARRTASQSVTLQIIRSTKKLDVKHFSSGAGRAFSSDFSVWTILQEKNNFGRSAKLLT